MEPDDIRFSSIKELRDWYYVEYRPPLPSYQFSTLHLTILGSRGSECIARAIEAEVKFWLARYPIPVMATAFSLSEDVIPLTPTRSCDHLLGWLDLLTRVEVLRWHLVRNDELPTVALDRMFLREVFSDVPYETGRQVREKAKTEFAAMKLGWWLVFVWAVVVPIGVAMVEWWSDLLGLAVLGYAFFKAAVDALRLTGKLPQSRSVREKKVLELKMKHYYYHCELNPKAFERLKADNFQSEAIIRSHTQAAALKGARSLDE